MEQIVIRGITKSFEQKKVLESIDITLEKGAFFTLLGPSGCGKTTLLRILAGFVKPDEGKIFFGDKEVTQLSAEHREVGMVFQNYALFPHMDVFENVAYGLKVKKLSKRDIDQKVLEYLQLVRLKGYEKRKVSELSGGEQQRVALARALVIEPKVLLLDEPLCNLDAKLRDELREEIRILQKKLGITTIFVTHDQKEALMLSDQVAVINQGRCEQVGSPANLYNQPENLFVATFVGEINVLDQPLVRTEQGKVAVIRPEQLRLYGKRQGIAQEFQGVIKSIQFNGPVTEYLLEIQGVQLKSVQISELRADNSFSVGQTVWIHIPLDAVKVLGE